jgi:hypothetical protein
MLMCKLFDWRFKSCMCAHRFIDYGGVYKLAFGPKAFIVVSDPVVVRHILKVSPCTAERMAEG